MTEVAPTEGRAALEALLALQDEDSAIDALEHRRATLPVRQQLAEHERTLTQLAAQEHDANTARAGHETRLSELANEVTEIVTRASRIDERLRSGQAASFRDQEAMAVEIGNLDRLRRDLDDEQLIVMEAIEPLETELASLADARKAVESEILRMRAELALAESEIDKEIATHRAARETIATTIPDDLLADYERLRRHLGGVGVARVIGGMCGGCHLMLSATELDRLRHAAGNVVVHCEQCGRILVL
jgi:uncharacterized protein